MRLILFFSLISILFIIGLFFMPMAQSADIEKGKIVFLRCAACHYADKNANKVGPSLLNVMGRKAGSLANYSFSPAMVEAGKNGIIWNKDTIVQYLHDPHGMIKGTRMASVRLNNDVDIDNLIAYLQSVVPPK